MSLSLSRLKQQAMELAIHTPSWGYGNSGTRFKTFTSPGAARNIWEKVEDAALIHRLSGIAPAVAIHIPWDMVEDWNKLRTFAEEQGLSIGAVNPNLFQDDVYKLGSIANPDERVRKQALAHIFECIEIMEVTGSQDLSLWFADGTNYAGQDSFRSRKARVRDSLQQVAQLIPEGKRILLEYKFFEPSFYFTDLFDWGSALLHSLALGEKVQVLVDLGHHAQATNIEAIVAFLLDEGKLGGFHFNARRYADDDLIVGSTNPFELFCIFHELVSAAQNGSAVAATTAKRVVYMIDQSHNIEPKLEAMLQSVLNCQEAYTKALLVDQEALVQAQQAGDVLEAHRILMDAYRTDVRLYLQEARAERRLAPDPIRALREGRYQEERAKRRV